jgi:hypothetical protein
MKAEGLVEKPFVPKKRSFTFPPVEKMGSNVVEIKVRTRRATQGSTAANCVLVLSFDPCGVLDVLLPESASFPPVILRRQLCVPTTGSLPCLAPCALPCLNAVMA